MDVGEHGEKYGDGSNHSLNTIHNLDAQFGRFYRWFARSRYADNTLLISTSDHAHYPEPSYVQVARDERTGDDGYDPYFVDRTPMLEIGRASCRERVCQYGLVSGGGGSLKKNTQQ